ncbi:MAG: zinc metallopeptidase [Eubacterium sp.]|nr:zinc metallopeptidase [Eubacterium sp.]
MFYYFDWTFIILLPAMILVAIAQFQVSSNFNKYSRVKGGMGITGAEAARKMLDKNGLYDVQIRPVKGSLTDHYDPRTKTVNLSEPVYGSDSVSAVGVACHECGHALQHAHSFFPLVFRNSIVPLVNIASSFSWILVVGGLVLMGMSEAPDGGIGSTILNIGIIAFLIVVLFHLVTLPVEINASHRAVVQISDMHLVLPENEVGVRKVLGAAALTYLGALVMALANLLRILAIANMSRRN